MSLFFFFFQAEDGIRDLTVTGVQTCALPICNQQALAQLQDQQRFAMTVLTDVIQAGGYFPDPVGDRKSTRLNSSHSQISYAVFCLKKKKQNSLTRSPSRSSPHLSQETPLLIT